jgi:hypothetical protein
MACGTKYTMHIPYLADVLSHASPTRMAVKVSAYYAGRWGSNEVLTPGTRFSADAHIKWKICLVTLSPNHQYGEESVLP